MAQIRQSLHGCNIRLYTRADWELMLGSRDPTDVLAQYASLKDTNKSTAGVRET